MFRTITSMLGYTKKLRGGWRLQPSHVFSAGFLTSAISAYPVAAYFDLVPKDISSAMQWVTGSGAPTAGVNPTAGVKPPSGSPAAFGQPPGQAAASSGFSANTNASTGKDLVSKIEDIGAQAFNGLYNTYQTSTKPTSAQPSAGFSSNNPVAFGGANYGNAGASYGQAPGDIACYFSPGGGCTNAIVNEIRQARQQIFMQAYSFTSVPIAQALVEARSRGVAVYIILDKSQLTEHNSGIDFVAQAGITTLIDTVHAIAHNKVMLIDQQTIITGSFNFTTSAEQANAENLLIIRGRPDVYQAYESNFRHHYAHCQPYQGRGTPAANSASPNVNRSYMPNSNYGPSNYAQSGSGYPPNNNYGQANNYAPANNYPPANNYGQANNSYAQGNYGYPPPNQYAPANSYGYPPSNNYAPANNYDYGQPPAYPQMAAPQSYAPSGHRY